MNQAKGLVIAAPFSSSGKTVITSGLIKAFKSQGLEVAPFKVGPDYIDPAYLARAANRPCYNLDSWMTGKKGVIRSFLRGAKKAHIAVIEGVMGLFDGAGGTTCASTAEVAKILDLPILLVFPARGFGHTAAAILKGLTSYWKELNFTGVILNGVASVKHERILQKALQGLDIPLLGVVTREKNLELPSRHLGLVQAEEIKLEEKLAYFAEKLAKETNLSEIIARLKETSFKAFQEKTSPVKIKGSKIAVARDKAFSFCYQENLDILKESGNEIVFFSPIKGEFPEKADVLYLPGGYPELFAETLSNQTELHEKLKKHVAEGMPVLAECGGFMFLLEGLEVNGQVFPMAGILPGLARMEKRLQAIGYREATFKTSNFLANEGQKIRGHEFHYSRVSGFGLRGLKVTDFEGLEVSTAGLVKENIIASYLHLHLGSL
ncbi:cobyrinic acid a,c-diamide synthase [Thermodesulfatator indicus DSM 15286]|uniref:Cobyrinate a,c-diamide synthase n=1 Tax=Thermodesulfatator indicus (strain DSM 15286 / JCM 11887 / CIR29812) TaxID=667014 RepID=F8A9R1_THEID|nr:cobyrinate a,c-diamide synthase [Thermodesulfatator indicus]AEH45751.1 cobyrinic acid a,c-diamide synthase [Thermodesulfatator indicus DSM 15286]